MGKPKSGTIDVRLTYSRQFKETKDKTVSLLEEIEKELGLKDLSKMKDPFYILERIHSSPEYPAKTRTTSIL